MSENKMRFRFSLETDDPTLEEIGYVLELDSYGLTHSWNKEQYIRMSLEGAAIEVVKTMARQAAKRYET